MGKVIDITGMKFNRLLVIEKTKLVKDRGMYWLCECECGERVEALGSDIRKGHTKAAVAYTLIKLRNTA